MIDTYRLEKFTDFGKRKYEISKLIHQRAEAKFNTTTL